jgi:hypothetical protein
LGFGPRIVRKNNIICVLFRSNVLLIMRRIDDYFCINQEFFVLTFIDREAIDWLEGGRFNV